MLAAPLMMGCDVRDMSDATKTILMNKDIIAIDQDPLGKQGFRVYRKMDLKFSRNLFQETAQLLHS